MKKIKKFGVKYKFTDEETANAKTKAGAFYDTMTKVEKTLAYDLYNYLKGFDEKKFIMEFEDKDNLHDKNYVIERYVTLYKEK